MDYLLIGWESANKERWKTQQYGNQTLGHDEQGTDKTSTWGTPHILNKHSRDTRKTNKSEIMLAETIQNIGKAIPKSLTKTSFQSYLA